MEQVMGKGVYARRVDRNQSLIVELARRAGISVAITSSLGNGFPDTVWAHRKHTVLVELKDGNKCPSQQKLTEAEQKFHDEWQGDIRIVRNEEEALQLIYEMRTMTRER